MPYLNPPTKEQYLDILKDIGTDEETLKRDVKYLMEWLEQTVYLPSEKDEEFLSSLLIRCKNSLETAKKFLDYYYSRRTLGTDMFAFRDTNDAELIRCLKMFCYLPLPNLTPDGYRVFIIRNKKDAVLPKMDCIVSALQMQQDVCLKLDINKGHILIYDSAGFLLSHSTALMSDMKKVIDMFTKTTKCRNKDTYLANLNSVFNALFNSMKHFLTEKLIGRVHIWTKKLEDFAEIIPKNILPTEFGGDAGPLEELKNQWFDCVIEHRDWFIAQQNMKADLSKRPKNDAFSAELTSFGLSGTFRKINLD